MATISRRFVFVTRPVLSCNLERCRGADFEVWPPLLRRPPVLGGNATSTIVRRAIRHYARAVAARGTYVRALKHVDGTVAPRRRTALARKSDGRSVEDFLDH